MPAGFRDSLDDFRASRGADVTLSLQQTEASVIHAADATFGVRPQQVSGGAIDDVRLRG